MPPGRGGLNDCDEALSKKAWNDAGGPGTYFPFIKDGPENLATPASLCQGAESQRATDTFKVFVDVLGLKVDRGPDSGAPVCIPDPEGGGRMTTVYATTGHALGSCGDLFLFKAKEGVGKTILQLQFDTRAWSFEASGIKLVYPNEDASLGCNVPLSLPMSDKWTDRTKLPDGWKPGACAQP